MSITPIHTVLKSVFNGFHQSSNCRVLHHFSFFIIFLLLFFLLSFTNFFLNFRTTTSTSSLHADTFNFGVETPWFRNALVYPVNHDKASLVAITFASCNHKFYIDTCKLLCIIKRTSVFIFKMFKVP